VTFSVHGALFLRKQYFIARCDTCNKPFFPEAKRKMRPQDQLCKACFNKSPTFNRVQKPKIDGPTYGFVGGCYDFRDSVNLVWEWGLDDPSVVDLVVIDPLHAPYADRFAAYARYGVITYPQHETIFDESLPIYTVSRARMLLAPLPKPSHDATLVCEDPRCPFWESVDYALNIDQRFLEPRSVYSSPVCWSFRLERGTYKQVIGREGNPDLYMHSYRRYLLRKNDFLVRNVNSLAFGQKPAILCSTDAANRNARAVRDLVRSAVRLVEHGDSED
jgi:hypothetical protein